VFPVSLHETNPRSSRRQDYWFIVAARSEGEAEIRAGKSTGRASAEGHPASDTGHETVRFWWNRFGTIFAAKIRRNRVQAMRSFRHRQWPLDKVFVKINGVKHDLWRAVDHEGEVLESFVTKRRDKKASVRFLRTH